MLKTMRTKESSLLYRKIDELGLSPLERSEALAALEASERLSDALYWTFEKIERLTDWLTPKPGLKHQ